MLIISWIFTGKPSIFNFIPKVEVANAAVAYQAQSAIAASEGADVTVTLPAHASGDILLLQVVVRDVDDTLTVTDWTQITTVDDGVAARHWWYWKRATSSSETDPLVDKSTGTGDTYAAVTTYRGATSSGDPWEVKGTATCTGTDNPSVLPEINVATANSLVVATWNDIDNFHASASYSATDPDTLTSDVYLQSAIGADGTCGNGSAVKTTTGLTGDVSISLSKAPDGVCGVVLALKPPISTFTLNDYRWYIDNDFVDPSDPWGNPDIAQDTAITILPYGNLAPTSTVELRLRTNFTVNGADLTAGSQQFKLQFKEATDATCNTGTWTDVGAQGSAVTWRFANSSVTTSLISVTKLSPASNVLESYVTTTPTLINPNSATSGEEIEYDFHIEHNGATSTAQYSFRVVESDDTVFDAYSQCPTLSTGPEMVDLMRHGNMISEIGEQGFYWADYD